MKHSNRILIMTALVSGSYGLTHTMTLNKLELNITSHHTKAFSKDNLYTSRLDQVELNAWNAIIKEVGKFVTEKNSFPQDKVLTKSMAELETISNELINGLKITYNNTFSGPTKTTVTDNEADRKNRKAEFLAIEKKVQTVERNLKKETYFLESKKEAKDALLFLCPYIETTALKARNDIDKEIAKRLKKGV